MEKHLVIKGTELKPVESSNLLAFGYDADNLDLYIQFAAKSIYRYADVPQSLVNDFGESQSKGKFFFRYIRDKYPYERIPMDTEEELAKAIEEENPVSKNQVLKA